MFNNKRPWLRMFAAEATSGTSEAATTAEPGSPAPGSPEPVAAPTDDRPAESDDSGEHRTNGEDEDPDGRGGKRAVLADLARERDKRQELQAQRDELQAQLDAINREKMTDQEKLQADLASEKERADKLAAELESERRKSWAHEALVQAGLPAAMADRLQGSTQEEILADAQALKAALGYDRAPVDPSQGKGGQKPAFKDMGAAISAHYNERK